MNTAWIITTLISFFGYFIGGIVGYVVKRRLSNYAKYLFIFSGGLLLGILIFQLIPKSLESNPNISIILGIIIGIILFKVFDKYVHKGQKQYHSILYLTIAIAIHNIPMGLAIGSSMFHSPQVTSSFLLSLCLHHIPEGLAIIVVINKINELRQFILIGLSLSMIVGFGTLVGAWLGTSIPLVNANAILIGMAIGSLWLVVFHEILFRDNWNTSLLKFIFVVLIGILTSGGYFLIV